MRGTGRRSVTALERGLRTSLLVVTIAGALSACQPGPEKSSLRNETSVSVVVAFAGHPDVVIEPGKTVKLKGFETCERWAFVNGNDLKNRARPTPTNTLTITEGWCGADNKRGFIRENPSGPKLVAGEPFVVDVRDQPAWMTSFPASVRAIVLDGFGQPVEGASVDFTVTPPRPLDGFANGTSRAKTNLRGVAMISYAAKEGDNITVKASGAESSLEMHVGKLPFNVSAEEIKPSGSKTRQLRLRVTAEPGIELSDLEFVVRNQTTNTPIDKLRPDPDSLTVEWSPPDEIKDTNVWVIANAQVNGQLVTSTAAVWVAS